LGPGSLSTHTISFDAPTTGQLTSNMQSDTSLFMRTSLSAVCGHAAVRQRTYPPLTEGVQEPVQELDEDAKFLALSASPVKNFVLFF
jgi:hypothetical protein